MKRLRVSRSLRHALPRYGRVLVIFITVLVVGRQIIGALWTSRNTSDQYQLRSDENIENEALRDGPINKVAIAKSKLEPADFEFPFSLTDTRITAFRRANSQSFCDTSDLYETFNVYGFPILMVAKKQHLPGSSFSCYAKSGIRYPDYGSGVHCLGKRIGINPSLVLVSRGGEEVQNVIGRPEEDEFPNFLTGSVFFGDDSAYASCYSDQIEGYKIQLETNPILASIVRQICEPNSKQLHQKCDEYDPVPTIFVMRFDYVDLYDTANSLLAAYQSLQNAIDLGFVNKTELARVIFMDGHAKGKLDPIWDFMFSKGRLETWRLGEMRFPPQKKKILCFDRVIFSETKTTSELHLQSTDTTVFGSIIKVTDPAESWWCLSRNALNAFRNVADMGKTYERPIQPTKPLALLIVRDQPIAPGHPREDISIVKDRSIPAPLISQLVQRCEEMMKRSTVAYQCQVVSFGNMSLAEQVGVVRSASSVIAVQGSELTHMLWARPETLFVELAPSEHLMKLNYVKTALRTGRYFARLAPASIQSNFLRMNSHTVHLNPDMFESLIGWSLLSHVEDKVALTLGTG